MDLRQLNIFKFPKVINKGRGHSINSMHLLLLLVAGVVVSSCARMGRPDGGWYDETPPHVIEATPTAGSAHAKSNKIIIHFNEFVKIDNPTENVVVSPPQLEAPEIKSTGKGIVVDLKDSLKQNTTYTIDFSDAITDNNEGNPLGNYTYSFSTGDEIDTMEVSGYVLEAENLEPIQGILVGLYADLSDSVFQKKPMLRVSRTDSYGHFVIRGIKKGTYKVYALQDADGNYIFNQKSEKLAFLGDLITPSSKPDIRQDTIWTDSLHIQAINRIGYTHFLPDDITLRAFTEVQTNRYLIKNERKEANHFDLIFSYGSKEVPQIKGLNFNDKNALLMESTPSGDTLTYWLRDSALINQDTLSVQLTYQATDSAGILKQKSDTLQLLSKQPYAKRLKEQQKNLEEWQKAMEKAKKKNEPYDSVMPKPKLDMRISVNSTMNPDENVRFSFTTPLAIADTSKIHLYAKHDSLWYISPFVLERQRDTTVVPFNDAYMHNTRQYVLKGEWRPKVEYSLELDSAAFVDIYGTASEKLKKGFLVKSDDDFSTIILTIAGKNDPNMIVQLLDNQDKVVKQVKVINQMAHFFYVEPRDYYVRLLVDRNHNGRWDTGNFDQKIQPEEVYYYPKKITCRAKWDFSETWNLTGTPLFKQKPAEITKQKGKKQRQIRSRNAKRAIDMGLEYVPGLMK